MQTAKPSVSEPQVGDIWRDKVGHHNLITDIYDDGEGVMCAALITLETGDKWPREPFDGWSWVSGDPFDGDTKPFFHTKVA